MRNDDSFRLFSEESVGRAIGVIAFFVLIYALVGTWDHADALNAEAQAKLDRAAAIEAEATLPLSHPIPWDAVVQQSGPGIDKAKPRLYVRASNRGEAK